MRHGTTLALALGLGGGALVWHFTRGSKRSRPNPAAPAASPAPPIASAAPVPPPATPTAASVPAQPVTPAASTTSPPAAATSGAPHLSPCSLRLDAWGLRLDGAEVDVPTAVERCKASGQADLTLEGNASAWIYTQLLAALGIAGVRVTRWKV